MGVGGGAELGAGAGGGCAGRAEVFFYTKGRYLMH